MHNPVFISRRRVLQGSAVVGTALAAGPLAVRAAQSMSPPKKIKVGVIGCGSVSRKYLPHLASCPFVELVSACDKIPDRARRAAEKFRPGWRPAKVSSGSCWGSRYFLGGRIVRS